ncbi:MAG TPA: helix-turn-helix domain-containing protein [Chthoniobacterales bacterium]|jgi:AraC-like DNA-binding protein
MSILKYQPRLLLRDFIELFWYRCGETPTTADETKEAILPDGCAHLVINLSENAVRLFERLDNDEVTTLSGSVFCGPRSSPYAILPAASAVIGILFRPGGAFPFLPMPAEELRNIQLPVEHIFGMRAGELRDRLIAEKTARRKFVLLEMFLLRHLRQPSSLHRAVSYAIRAFETDPTQNITDVLMKIGLSERRFSRVFSEQVGLTPKQFHRVRRFQKTISSFPLGDGVDWAETALNAGYYDQAHLIHEFRTFSFVTPGTFLATRIVQRNHLPLPA